MSSTAVIADSRRIHEAIGTSHAPRSNGHHPAVDGCFEAARARWSICVIAVVLSEHLMEDLVRDRVS